MLRQMWLVCRRADVPVPCSCARRLLPDRDGPAGGDLPPETRPLPWKLDGGIAVVTMGLRCTLSSKWMGGRRGNPDYAVSMPSGRR